MDLILFVFFKFKINKTIINNIIEKYNIVAIMVIIFILFESNAISEGYNIGISLNKSILFWNVNPRGCIIKKENIFIISKRIVNNIFYLED